MSCLFGGEHLLLRQGALPPFARGDVTGVAQLDEGPGQPPAGRFEGEGLRGRVGEDPFGAGAGLLRGGGRPLDAAARPAVGTATAASGPTAAPTRVSRARSPIITPAGWAPVNSTISRAIGVTAAHAPQGRPTGPRTGPPADRGRSDRSLFGQGRLSRSRERPA
ncbi:hypothetical protein GCM10010518_08490 [Kitasatospora cinereorecta]